MSITTEPTLITDVLELAELERHARPWSPWLESIRATGVPMLDGDAGDDGGDDGGDGDGGNDDDNVDAGNGDDNDDDGNDDDSDLAKARRAAAAANRELAKSKREAAEAKAKALKDAGKYKELYEEKEAELNALRKQQETAAKESLVIAALTKANAKNPARAAKLLELDEIDDEADAIRAVRKLTKSDDYLFAATATRQKRGAGGGRDEDDTDNDERPKAPVNRLRRGLEATSK